MAMCTMKAHLAVGILCRLFGVCGAYLLLGAVIVVSIWLVLGLTRAPRGR
jgi:hypothetical protein